MKRQSCQFEFTIVVWVSDFMTNLNIKTKRTFFWFVLLPELPISSQNSDQASVKLQSEPFTIYSNDDMTY